MKLSNYMQLYNYNNQDTKQFPLFMTFCNSPPFPYP